MSDIFANVPQMRASGVAASFARAVLSMVGWRMNFPTAFPEKCVIVVYPHTSNWDFPIGLLCKWASGIQLHYLGKASLFSSPLGWFFRATGGIAVDRKNPRGLVEQMIARFNAPGVTRLVIAPEGTRGYVPTLKTGFYRIALAAKVPLVVATIDYATKRAGVLTTLGLTGDEAADLAQLRAAYAGVQGKTSKNMGEIAF